MAASLFLGNVLTRDKVAGWVAGWFGRPCPEGYSKAIQLRGSLAWGFL